MAEMTAEDLWDIFSWSVTEQKNDFERLVALQNTYDNVVKESVWPTISKIPLATAWSSVEEALGPAMEYLFPKQPFVNLIPDGDVDGEVLRNLEWSLYLMMTHRMRLERATLRSVKDCFKVGVGYGIIEPMTVTPPAAFDITAGENTTRQMGVGRPVTTLVYRYLSPGKVIPYPSGVDFNGQDATPIAFHIDMYPEDQFLGMFSDQPHDGETVVLRGDAQKMVDESRTIGMSEQASAADYIDKLAGRKTGIKGQRATQKNIPTMVPVLKCYLDNRHVWIFPGKEKLIVFDRSNSFSTMRKPLIKWDAWMDADRWFPMSQPEADQRTGWAKNIWLNLFFDLATWSAKRPLLYDSDRMDDAPEFGPRNAIGIPGDVRTTARFMDPPGMDAGSLQMGQEIDSIRSKITGQKDFTERNFTRGGSHAFQDLLQSSNGRERLRMALLQLGGLEPTAIQTLAYMQVLGGQMDLRFSKAATRRESGNRGDKYTEIYEITEDDLKHTFQVVLDLDSKHRKGSMDMQNKFAAYDRKISNPAFDNYEVSRDLCIDEEEAMRQVLPREEVEAKQRAQEQAQLEALRAQGAPPGGAPPAAGETAAIGAELGGAA
ncbi:MAG TPA: hypothetical protein VNA25_17345 [Phycisphaerae bacterium]|nr:hypothetical protein [Phycisphaerae bacterium]